MSLPVGWTQSIGRPGPPGRLGSPGRTPRQGLGAALSFRYHMAVSTNWGSLKGELGAPVKGLWS